MRIDLSDDKLQLLIRAVEHYDACLLSQNRPEAAYADPLKSLKRFAKQTFQITRASWAPRSTTATRPLGDQAGSKFPTNQVRL
jgi:hypothetical protein